MISLDLAPLPPPPKTLYSRVFSEVPFWNSAESGILSGIDFISRNYAGLFTVQYRGIPYRFMFTEFRIPSNENSTMVG
jgi:hypothetical protein